MTPETRPSVPDPDVTPEPRSSVPDREPGATPRGFRSPVPDPAPATRSPAAGATPAAEGARPTKAVRPAGAAVLAGALAAALLAVPADAQITRHPTGVNVNATDATTVFISFGNLEGYVPVEALWCGELIPATPDVGNRCDPSTVFGSLPLRYEMSRPSGRDGLTDIMSIPPSVARRAYQAAADGANSAFFYVRRFVDPQGVGPDQYVTVTCRLTGGGARVPFSLLDVRLRFAADEAQLSLESGATPPPVTARIAYNGTGRLVGRWEVVLPGEEPPTQEDLLTEATLPAELRGTQRRYAEIERFNVFLPPGGEYVLEGPAPDRLPTEQDGLYMLLLRIEASDDKEGDSDLASAGSGTGLVHTGAVAGFPMPPLRYFVGAPDAANALGERAGFRLLLPAGDVPLPGAGPVRFTWSELPEAVVYRLDVRSGEGDPLLSALVEAGDLDYGAPPWLEDRSGGEIAWQVVGLGPDGAVRGRTAWRYARWEG